VKMADYFKDGVWQIASTLIALCPRLAM